MKMGNTPPSLNEDQMDYTTSSTSTLPRKWKPPSLRWREKLEKLANTDDSEVVKFASFVIGKSSEFLIKTGSHGTDVVLGLRNDGTEVAVKKMTKTNFEALKNEQRLLGLPKLDHPSIVQYVDFAEDANFGYLALQLCEYTLEEYITKHSPTEVKRKELANQVLNGLRVLHCQNPQILHRDIKPQNVLIDSEGKARLADFGISRELDEGQTTKYTSLAGTERWIAKEIMEPGEPGRIRYKKSSDIQVAGMLIYYILSGGHHPFGDDFRCLGNIYDGKYNLDDVQDVEAKHLIERMINADPKKRPSVEECLDHLFWSNERVEHGGEDPLNPHLSSLKRSPTTHFVDQHQLSLIQRVTMVDPILHLLLYERAITVEGYHSVRSKTTTQQKMRELYRHLNSRKAKDRFYEGLEEHEKFLLDDIMEHAGEDRFNSPQRSPTTHFVDQNRRFLIQSLTMVDPILNLLLEENVITAEGYDNVRSKSTTQDQMRELYRHLNSRKAKDLFYKGLEEHEKLLLDDLRDQTEWRQFSKS